MHWMIQLTRRLWPFRIEREISFAAKPKRLNMTGSSLSGTARLHFSGPPSSDATWRAVAGLCRPTGCVLPPGVRAWAVEQYAPSEVARVVFTSRHQKKTAGRAC